MRPLNDFQVFKGRSEETMKAFGGPVMAHHEARLLVSDDQKTSGGAIYAIYKRSENRILQILRAPEAIYVGIAA
jgi:hypothetical protein